MGDFFCVTLHSEIANLVLPTSFTCSSGNFIPKLASLIRSIAILKPPVPDCHGYTSQLYVWTSIEQNLLQAHIIDAALYSSASNEDVGLCIGAIAQGASLLQTTFQPLLLSGALITFLGKGKQLKSDYQACLARMGLSTEGTAEVLKKRINEGIQKIQEEMASSPGDEFHRQGFGQLPRVVPLMKEVQRQLAFPISGYWDLPQCAKMLLPMENPCPTDEHLFALHKQGKDRGGLAKALLERNHLVYSVLKEFRSIVSASHPSLFVNEAKILSANLMDMCREPHIKKLFFMQQVRCVAMFPISRD